MRFLELAHAAADRGFTSLALGEHTHIPVSSDPSLFPGAGSSIPDSYRRLLDPYVALSFVAAQTPLKIATCTSLPAMHDPIALAKGLATLDFLADGRLTLGVGYGWNRDEFASHGRDYARRRAIVREHVELMRQLRTQVEAEYHGEHANLERSWSWPKPVKSTIQVLLGAAGQPLAMKAIVDWADGWMPGGPVDYIAGKLSELRRRWSDAGLPEAGRRTRAAASAPGRGRRDAWWPVQGRPVLLLDAPRGEPERAPPPMSGGSCRQRTGMLSV
jgi:probable F420-dependent oxidoreductase